MNGVLDGIIDQKIRNILNVFLKNNTELFHLQKVSRLSNVPISSSFRLIKKLVNLGFVSIVKIDKFKVYKLAENKKTRQLIGIFGK